MKPAKRSTYTFERQTNTKRPYVIDLNGKRTTYSRPSTIAKVLDNTYNLQRWAERTIMHGVTVDDSLVDAARSVDPDTPEGARELNVLARRAFIAGGGEKKMKTGSAIHELFERVLAGECLPDKAPMKWRPLVHRFLEALNDHGLEVMATEVPVVNHELRVAGSLDYYMRCTKDHAAVFEDRTVVIPAGTVFLGDTKTGNIGYQTGSMSMQFAQYATGVPCDSEGKVLPEGWEHGAPSTEVGLLVGVTAPPDCEPRDASVTLRWIELTKGLRALRELAFRVKKFQGTKTELWQAPVL